MIPPQLIFAAAQTIPQLIGAFRQNKLANKINPVREAYNVSPYAKNFYGIANQIFNARMPGADMAQQAIQGNLGRAVEGIERNASDSSSALAALSGVVAGSNDSMLDLAMKQAQNKQNNIGTLSVAANAMTNELDKVYQDKLSIYNEQVAAKTALRQSAADNFSRALGGMSDLAGLIGGSIGKGAGSKGFPASTSGIGPIDMTPAASVNPGGRAPGPMPLTFQNQFYPGISQLPNTIRRNPLNGLPM